MERHFICLANSLKRRGRCIAGIEVTINHGRWTVVRKADGTPRWIRPIDRTTEFGEILIDEARTIPLLSIVTLEDVEPIPQQAHQEDVLYSRMKVIGRTSDSTTILRLFEDRLHPVIFYGTDRAIDVPTYIAADHSLMFIHADAANIVTDIREDKTRYRMLLTFNNVTYDLSVTDPDYIEALNTGRASVGIQSDIYVTLSLGLVYEERHHKLVAAVVVPGRNIADNVILPIDVQSKPLSVRHLTKTERHTIRSVSIVPCQDGLAVRFCRKNGGEDFLSLEEGSNACAWDNVKPRRLQIVTYDNGKEKARLLSHCHPSLFQFIRELWFLSKNKRKRKKKY